MPAISARAQGDYVRARVESVTGFALISVGSKSVALRRKDQVEPGNVIETGHNSRVVLSLSDGSQITVLPNSKVVLKNFLAASSARELLEIIVGRVFVKIRSAGGKPNPYRLSSPAASIAVRGTEFIVDVLQNGETLVLVREGLVEVWSRENPNNRRLVPPGSRVLVRLGGDISSVFPGPELKGISGFNGYLGEDYQRSVNSVAQSSGEISPIFFSAFADRSLDSLENPAYAAEFKSAEGRLLLLPSVSEPYYPDDKPLSDYSVSPQATFFMPIPGSRLVLGGGASAFAIRSRYLTDHQFSGDRYHYQEGLRLSAFNVSFIAAYSFGDQGKTSVGISVDRLSGDGNFLSERVYKLTTNKYYDSSLEASNARFARARLTLGFTRRFSNSGKFGLYFRQGIGSSDQRNQYRQGHEDATRPLTSYFQYGGADISSLSSEVGARFRASLTRRLFYGVEGSYLYERIDSRSELVNRPSIAPASLAWSDGRGASTDRRAVYNRYLARRARVGAGVGFAPTSRILLDFDVTGGLFNNDRPPEEPLNSSGGLIAFSLSSGSLGSIEGTSMSLHTAVQANLWRGLFLSVSSIRTVRGELFFAYLPNYRVRTDSDGLPIYEIEGYRPYTYKIKDASQGSNISLGWKFKPNLTTEYLYSIDHSYQHKTHSFRLRYTFDLGVIGEK